MMVLSDQRRYLVMVLSDHAKVPVDDGTEV